MITSDPEFWSQSAGGGGGGGGIAYSRMVLTIHGDVSHLMGSKFRYSVMRQLNLHKSVFVGQKSGQWSH